MNRIASFLSVLPLSLLLLTAALPGATHAGRRAGRDLRAVQWRAPAVDVDELRREDRTRRNRPGTPTRVGRPFRGLGLTPRNSGVWSEDERGGKRWELSLSSPGALWLVIGLDRFDLPAGAQLFIRGPERDLGPFTESDARAHGELWTPPLAGDSVTLELLWPASLGDTQPDLKLGTLSHGYEPWGGVGEQEAHASSSDACHVDVACAEGEGWDDARRGVVQLLSGGFAFCSGSLINNTSEDCRPLVLTAAHCGAGPSTSFRFNYERESCGGGLAPTDQILTGASVLASWNVSDFALLELDEAPPPSFDVHYNGWRRQSGFVASSAVIHHPQGDVKKISTNDDWLTDGLFWGGSHWRVNNWETGATQGGSSGAPLLDRQNRIVGQLHGGTVSCENDGWDEFGKISFSFPGNGSPNGRLSDWLDPDGIGTLFMSGLDASACHLPAPQLALGDVELDDFEGDGDGRLDPGESVRINLEIRNSGDAAAYGVVGALSSTAGSADWDQATASWPAIAAGSGVWSQPDAPVLRLPADWDCAQPLSLELQITESGGAQFTESWTIPVGEHGSSLLLGSDAETDGAPWSTESVDGPGGWELSDSRSHSGESSWFVANASEAMEARLRLQPFVPDSDDYELRFRHFFDTETDYDGGVLELRLDSGSWDDAAPRMLSGGYNSQLEPSLASPLAERQAWSGASGDWREVVVDLAGLAGRTVELRWRFATDASTGGEGWYVDDLEVRRETIDCAPWTAEPPPELGGMRLDRQGELLQISWDDPDPALGQARLYRRPVDSIPGTWQCDASAGTNTTLSLPLPAGSSAFLIGLEAEGTIGSLGRQSGGSERIAADCP